MIETRPAEECELDIVALGEVMLRLDPGEGRIRTARRFEAWEGGGEYNVARGYDVCKFFPAEANGGLPTIKALAAAFPQVRFVPTGGITVESAPAYLAHPSVAAVGGSWMVAGDLLTAGRWDEVAAKCTASTALYNPTLQGAPA